MRGLYRGLSLAAFAAALLILVPAAADATVVSADFTIEGEEEMDISVEVLPSGLDFSSKRYAATTVAEARNRSLKDEVLHLLDNYTGNDPAGLVARNIVNGTGIRVRSAAIYLVELASATTSRPTYSAKGLRVTATVACSPGRWTIDEFLPVYGLDGEHDADDEDYTPTIVLTVKGSSRVHIAVGDGMDTMRFPWGEEAAYSWGWDEFDNPELVVTADDSILLSPILSSVVELVGAVLLIAGAVALSVLRRQRIVGFLLVGLSLAMIPPSLLLLLWPGLVHPLAYAGVLLVGGGVLGAAVAVPGPKAPRKEEAPAPEPAPIEETHYTVLGVPEDASFDDLKRAYKSRLHEYHPDKVANAGPKIVQMAAEETMKITKAYEVLKETGTRRKYDDELEGRRKNGI